MHIVGESVVRGFVRKHPDAGNWLKDWVDVTKRANWRSLADVRREYPHADGIKLPSGRVVTVFNVRGNAYRMLTLITYPSEFIEVVSIMTHAEYDKNKWKKTL